jgi:hypothetical protein
MFSIPLGVGRYPNERREGGEPPSYKTVNHDIGALTLSAIYHLFPILQKGHDMIFIYSPGIPDFYLIAEQDSKKAEPGGAVPDLLTEVGKGVA